MPRNPLSAGHLLLLGTACFLMSGCDTMNSSPWIPSAKSTNTATTQATPPNGTAPALNATDLAKPITTQSKVALLLPLSGKGAETGQAMLNAAQLAMFDLNANSVFELMPIDTGRGASEAMTSAVQKGANLVLGPVFSPDTKAVTPLALQNGLNVISFSTDTSAAVGNTFLMGFMPQAQVNTVLNYASSQGMKRLAVIAPYNVYGDSVASTYLTFIQRYALNNVAVIRYQEGQLPTEADLAGLKSGVDAVLIASPAMEAHKISNLMSAEGLQPLTVKRLGTGLWDQADAAKLTGLQGAWYAASSPRLRNRFEHRYFETYGTQPPRLASLAYDATALAVVMTKSGQGFGRGVLTNPNGFAGIDGIFRFTSEGLADRGLAIMEIQNGAASTIQDAPQRFSSR